MENTALGLPPFWPFMNDPWVEKKLERLDLDAQLAQLLHVAAYSNRGPEHAAHLLALVQDHGIGGMIFFQGTPHAQAGMINQLQAVSETPLLVSMDAEWGLGMRLDGTAAFPYAMTLGATQDPGLAYETGAEIARQCRRAGICWNFAPVADINNNPQNPVISFRSFGSDMEQVAVLAAAFAQGMQDHGVLACAKHFPGHGDTATDSHFGLPVLHKDRQSLEQNELYPFRELARQGVGSIMTGHLQVPALDPALNTGATLSRPMTEGLLKQQMGFKGLVVTDALDMKGVAAFFSPADIARKAFVAGNDVLLFVTDVPGALAAMKAAVNAGEVTAADVAHRCRKQLAAKRWAGLHEAAPIALEGIADDTGPAKGEGIQQKTASTAITLLKGSLPQPPAHAKTAVVSLLAGDGTPCAPLH